MLTFDRFTKRQFIRSSFCASGECVEVAHEPRSKTVWVRHSQEVQGIEIVLDYQEWSAFIAGVRAGKFREFRPHSGP